MRNLVVSVALSLCCALPVAAQEDDGTSMMDLALRQLLEGLMLEMEPAFDSMRAFIEEMGPAMAEVFEEVQDWSDYEVPEVLDNGDIIIRRKPDRELKPDPVPNLEREPLPQIEL